MRWAILWGIVAALLINNPVLAATCGLASYYGSESGSVTANGERFNPMGLTAASKKLKFGTRIRVSYMGNTVIVRINDRGPYIKGRILDLSKGAARKIGLTKAGVGKICYVILN